MRCPPRRMYCALRPPKTEELQVLRHMRIPPPHGMHTCRPSGPPAARAERAPFASPRCSPPRSTPAQAYGRGVVEAREQRCTPRHRAHTQLWPLGMWAPRAATREGGSSRRIPGEARIGARARVEASKSYPSRAQEAPAVRSHTAWPSPVLDLQRRNNPPEGGRVRSLHGERRAQDASTA